MTTTTDRHSHHEDGTEVESISRITRRLTQQFPQLGAATVASVVNRHYHTFDGRPIRDFIPVLVERAAREDLNRASHADSKPT